MSAQPTPIGFLVKRFPKLSETFVLEEVLGLERLGVPLRLYTLAPPSDAITHPAVARVKASVTPVPASVADDPMGFAARHARWLLWHPVRYVTGLRSAARRGRQGLNDFARAGWLAGQLRDDGVAHLHTHFISSPADVAALVAQISGVPFSISAHAKDIYTADPLDLRRKLEAARFTVTCTEFNAQALRRLAPDAAVHRMYHGIDAAVFHPSRRYAPTHSATLVPRLLSVGRLREKKGLDTLVDACALLRDRGLVFRCEIVGYGEEHDRLMARIAERDLSSHVQLTGKLTREEVVERYARTRVYVQPSRVAADGDRDGIPNVLLEAMAMGLPVVATAVSGIPEVVRDGVNGLLVEPDDAAALADAIARVIDAPDLAAALGRAARATVTEAFDNDRNLRVVLQLLERVHTSAMSHPIAYVMNGFPRLSETFIAHEIHQLERLGLDLRLYSVKRENEPLVHPVVHAIRAPLTYLPKAESLSGASLGGWLRRNLPTFWRDHAYVAARHPLRWLGALGTAARLAWQHRSRDEQGALRLRKVFVKEFLQAGAIAADVLRQGRVSHLHGHFCHGVATITWLASRMTGLSYSFTAHAKDIYQAELNPGDLLERKMHGARFVATCTCANAGVLRLRHPRPDEVHAIYHGLDTDWFAPAPRPEGPSAGLAPLILAVGRFVEKKGFDQLVAACALLRDAGVHFGCLIVGERGSAYEPLRAQIAAAGLQNHIRLKSAVTQDELRGLYASARLFALPCQVMEDGDRDGFPNVLAESMAMGVPVVTTRISGIPELIDDGVHGLLVEPRDPAGLAEALRRLLQDDALRERLARDGRQRICDRFDSRRTTVALRDLFVAQLPTEARESLVQEARA